jgi:hypothetical protein
MRELDGRLHEPAPLGLDAGPLEDTTGGAVVTWTSVGWSLLLVGTDAGDTRVWGVSYDADGPRGARAVLTGVWPAKAWRGRMQPGASLAHAAALTHRGQGIVIAHAMTTGMYGPL